MNRLENNWLRHSQMIAIKMLNEMRRMNMTQKALADKLGCTQQYVSKILRGKENLSLETLCKIERALGIQLTIPHQTEKTQRTKIILDVCCGSRMFWFDKENPLTMFVDIRNEKHKLCDGRSLNIHPDIVADFTNIPFSDESFKLVVFDPPHLLKAGENSWLVKKYGKLSKDWPKVIKKEIDECFRVLEYYGVLIFKWSEIQITVKEVLSIIDKKPLFGHTTGRNGKTIWMCFMKLPN